MTAQIGDIYKYKKKEFTVVALSSVMLFDPKNYGMEPHASSTACWRGYCVNMRLKMMNCC